MTRKDYVYITDVVPGKQNWQVKVVLCEKSEPRTSYSGGTRYMRTVLLDEKGQKVVATVFDGNIEPLKKKLVLYQTYLIKNARVRPLDHRYNTHGYSYQWTLTTQTCITPVTDQPIPRAAVKQNFVSLGQLQKPSIPGDLIDVLVVVIDKGIKRNVGSLGDGKMVRDLGVINEDNRPMALTLWNNIADSEGKLIDETMESMPVIKATGLCVSSFYGLSLRSTTNTSIVVDPQIPEAQILKNWRSANLKLISDAISEKRYLAFDDSITMISEKDVTSLADVVSINTVFKFLVRVKVSIVDGSQKVYYMSCNECTGGVDAEMGDTYICTHCCKSAIAIPRHKISIKVSDDSGSLNVVAFGDSAEKIIKHSAKESMEAYEKGMSVDTDHVNSQLADTVFLARIRKRERGTRNGVEFQYTVISIVPEGDIQFSTPPSSVGYHSDSKDHTGDSKGKSVSKALFCDDAVESGDATSSSTSTP